MWLRVEDFRFTERGPFLSSDRHQPVRNHLQGPFDKRDRSYGPNSERVRNHARLRLPARSSRWPLAADERHCNTVVEVKKGETDYLLAGGQRPLQRLLKGDRLSSLLAPRRPQSN